MKQYVSLIVVLTVICLVASLALAVVNRFTKDRIAQVAAGKKMAAIAEVLPDTGTVPRTIVVADPATGASNTFYVVEKDGRFAGAAVETSSPNGYAGDIRLMVGINLRREIQAIAILEQRETPGLGAKIATDGFKGGYAGVPIDTTRFKVKKDGGDMDAITAATISSRAVAEAVADAVRRFTAAQGQLMREPEPLPSVLEDIPDEVR